MVITDEDFDKKYLTECVKKVTYTPDKKAIKEVIERVGQHPGAELKESISLTIK